ncbi:aminodeoxychorismate/anthranilate synthase component II [Salibacteraceae bacterium]|nr:aminodeoxychorismate/anthranilate synthase component II [Salibacteraceae bacterium]
MKVLIVDNYDSFTFNLKHYFELYCDCVEVVRNDSNELWNSIEKCDRIVLSPGPGLPKETLNLNEIIERFSGKKPILGVCLGHQAIGEFYGAAIINLNHVLHGKSTQMICLKNDPLFNNLPKTFNVARYHSWSLCPTFSANSSLDIIATDAEDRPLAIRHKTHNIRGIQFHPESILTEHGMAILKNWVKNC